jgi:hypothetical protein
MQSRVSTLVTDPKGPFRDQSRGEDPIMHAERGYAIWLDRMHACMPVHGRRRCNGH